MVYKKVMFMSMEVEIMQTSFLVDEMLERLSLTVIQDVVSPYMHFGSMGGIERFRRVLLRLRDFIDAEASREKWIIDYLRLGQYEGLIFEGEHVPRSEISAVRIWWTQLRVALDDAKDALDEISINTTSISQINTTSISQNEGFHTFTEHHHVSSYLVDTSNRPRESLHDSIILKPPDPKRIDALNVDRLHDVVGRQDDVNRIVELLVSSAHCETTTASADVHVIPVVGDSGIGKTTLAKLVYSDHRLESHFDKKMWVSFSNCYVGILKSTMSFLDSSTVGEASPNDIIDAAALDLDLILSLLQSSLYGKKFLLVLDGVSNGICCDWGSLHVPLMTGGIGSRILVTTRSSLVSSTLGTVPTYYLRPLSYEDCWQLFTRMASLDSTANIAPTLQCYQDMVELFEGFPSLVVALGYFSHSKPDERKIKGVVEWIRYHKSDLHISSTLLQTYYGMSSMHLKQCLLYCAMFPKGYEFQKHKLVWLWMAEGFLQSKGGMTMEEVGFTYFEELYQASFFQLEHDDFIRHDSSYVIPDIVQNLLEYLSGNEYIRIENAKACLSEYTRHLSFICKGVGGQFIEAVRKSKGLHTLILLGQYHYGAYCTFKEHIENLPRNLFHDLTRLRVLDISYSRLLEVPDSVCHLKHLRFLDLSENNFKRLPEEMSMLHNLQTLIIKGSKPVSRFPRDMGKLLSLRHLILGAGLTSFIMPPGIGKLTNLQTLPAFTVGKDSDESGSIEELRELKYLQGSLVLLGLEDVSLEKASHGGWLLDKAYLLELEFVWYSPENVEVSESVLLGLQPHENLKRLRIFNYCGCRFPNWMGSPLYSNLETIKLCSMKSSESLPPLGQLPLLKFLRISRMDKLKYIGEGFLGNHRTEDKSFPSLKFLEFNAMYSLETWTGLGANDMPHLEELTISWCHMLISLPTLQFLSCLRTLNIWSCSKLESLPSEGLPSSVQSLVINSCPLLSKKSAREG